MKVRSLTPSARGNAMKNRGTAQKGKLTASMVAKAKAQGRMSQKFGKGPKPMLGGRKPSFKGKKY